MYGVQLIFAFGWRIPSDWENFLRKNGGKEKESALRNYFIFDSDSGPQVKGEQNVFRKPGHRLYPLFFSSKVVFSLRYDGNTQNCSLYVFVLIQKLPEWILLGPRIGYTLLTYLFCGIMAYTGGSYTKSAMNLYKYVYCVYCHVLWTNRQIYQI